MRMTYEKFIKSTIELISEEPSKFFCSLDAEVYSSFMNEVFNASLFNEEGKAVKTELILSTSDAPAPNISRSDIAFTKLKEFSARTIAKLSPALNQTIFVSFIKGQLKITGIILGREENIHARLNPVYNALGYQLIQGVTVKIKGAGVIEVDYSGCHFVYDKGEVFQPSLNISRVHDVSVMDGVIDELDIKKSKNDQEFFLLIALLIAHKSLWCVLRYMQQGGFGGTIIFVDDDSEWEKHVQSFSYGDLSLETLSWFKWSVKNFLLEAMKKADWENKNFSEVDGNSYKNLKDAERALAAFTRVDGAVILNKKLEFKGFGGKLKFSGDEECEESQDSPKGMRHKSAQHFCKTVKDAVAFVVSQDGNITRFHGNEYEQVVLD
ncbi:MAG: hypothetical protein D3911_12795 [Candidatus Electrothrix sp. AW3_4]|nr:hypothetical protein [Candidatus Electrothrix gigas]